MHIFQEITSYYFEFKDILMLLENLFLPMCISVPVNLNESSKENLKCLTLTLLYY